MLWVGVKIKQIKNKHLQNWLIFPVWIIWGAQTKFGGALTPNVPVATGLSVLDQTKRCCPLHHETVNGCNYCKAPIAKAQSSSTVQIGFEWYFVENIFF